MGKKSSKTNEEKVFSLFSDKKPHFEISVK
jgi:hypothetical protein